MKNQSDESDFKELLRESIVNQYEKFDFLKVRYNYSCRFAATNFKTNNDWLK